jgi:uncharacterized membrane protein
MVGLGSLVPDGWSRAIGISGDNRVIVGEVGPPTSSDSEAFRWTQSGGMVGLGDLPGGIAKATATAASFDGSVIVGHGNTAMGTEAFIWDDTNGMRNLREVLEDDFSLDLTGWVLQAATDVSDNGLKIVGYGINPMGKRKAWVASPVKMRIIHGGGVLALVGLLLAAGAVMAARSRRSGSTP